MKFIYLLLVPPSLPPPLPLRSSETRPVISRDWSWSVNFLQLQRSHTHVKKCLAFDFSHSFHTNSAEPQRSKRPGRPFSSRSNLKARSCHPILHFFFPLVVLKSNVPTFFFSLSNIHISLQNEDSKIIKEKKEHFFALWKSVWKKTKDFFGRCGAAVRARNMLKSVFGDALPHLEARTLE